MTREEDVVGGGIRRWERVCEISGAHPLVRLTLLKQEAKNPLLHEIEIPGVGGRHKN